MNTESKTTVVNLKTDSFDVYIGRKNTFKSLDQSPFANPFPIGPGCDRRQSIAKFTEYLKENPALMEKAKTELKGKRLGCWCWPLDCHGDVLARLVNTGSLDLEKDTPAQQSLSL